jgi:tetratricopeptide (TPR) repeat protein
MSYLLETLGRGLLRRLQDAFAHQLPKLPKDNQQDLTRRLELSPDAPDLWLRLGVLKLEQAQLSDAEKAFAHAHELDADAPQPMLGLACVWDERGGVHQALHWLGKAKAVDKTDPAIAFALGLCHEHAGHEVAAQREYRRAQQLNPSLRNAHERLAAIAAKSGGQHQAASAYRALAELDPGDLDALLLSAAWELQTGDHEAAINGFQRALLVEPVGGETIESVESLTADGRIQEALLAAEDLAAQFPGIPDYHVQLGDLYAKVGDEKRAVDAYRTALEYEPNYLEATVKLGTHQIRCGDLQNAGHTFTQAVELSDRLVLAFVGLGVAQHAAGLDEESEATFNLAVGLEPNSRLLLAETARLYFESRGEWIGEPDDITAAPMWWEAARKHLQALWHTPNDAGLHYRFGVLMRQLGEPTQAIEAFQNAVSINPQFVKAWLKLGLARYEAGEQGAALAAWQHAFTLDQQACPRYHELALLFSQRSQFELALDRFESALGKTAKRMTFAGNLILALQNVGMLDRTRAMWNALADMDAADDPLLSAREHTLRTLGGSVE